MGITAEKPKKNEKVGKMNHTAYVYEFELIFVLSSTVVVKIVYRFWPRNTVHDRQHQAA